MLPTSAVRPRFELKYTITESLALRLRDFVSCHHELDEHASGRSNLSYPVHTLYLDSDDLKTHQATVDGIRNRFKLRLRYYDEEPDNPVFFEVKARANSCIVKHRCVARRHAVPTLASGQLAGPDDLVSDDGFAQAAMQRFGHLVRQIDARPRVHVRYLREAWASPSDRSLRVTFDRDIRVAPCFSATPCVAMINPKRIFPELVVLEIKFTTRFPSWLSDMVRLFDLTRSAAAKYSTGVVALGASALRGETHAPPSQWGEADWAAEAWRRAALGLGQRRLAGHSAAPHVVTVSEGRDP